MPLAAAISVVSATATRTAGTFEDNRERTRIDETLAQKEEAEDAELDQLLTSLRPPGAAPLSPAASGASTPAAVADPSSTQHEAAPSKGRDGARRTPAILKPLVVILTLLNNTVLQFFMYLAFVMTFQLLQGSLTSSHEFYFNKMIQDTFIDNTFDAALNTFSDVRRSSDIWEWGNTVVWPGFFGNAGPCGSDPGSDAVGLTALVQSKRAPAGCNDDVWPDGSGSFALGGGTGFTVEEQLMRMDQLDWTEGIFVRQVRVRGVDSAVCGLSPLAGTCYGEPENSAMPASSSTSGPRSFGFNWTDHTASPRAPWLYHTAEQLGTDPNGAKSAFMPSLRTFEGGGYVATAIPFFSPRYLPEERGTAEQILDFRQYAFQGGGWAMANGCTAGKGKTMSGDGDVDVGSGISGIGRALNDAYADGERGFDPQAGGFFCVRLSHNGVDLHQLCDPNVPALDPLGRTSGVVRAAVETWWNDLKRGHFVDMQTRMLYLTFPLRNNNFGIRSRVKMMFETTSYGAVLPSYDIETRVYGTDRDWGVRVYSHIAFGFCVLFMLLELVEILAVGPLNYFQNSWNLMDWFNFVLVLLMWICINDLFAIESARDCSIFCGAVGYCDDWRIMSTVRWVKNYLAWCVCIQLLKVVKFTDALVPKMSLATTVLYTARSELAFFTFVFAISMFAFSQLFYVQLGPVMERFNTQQAALISLTRSLFGDFDIEDILNNSNDFLNAALYLLYLFVAIFILLSMFLAILGEAQGKVRTKQEQERAEGTLPPEYGVLGEISDAIGACYAKARLSWRPSGSASADATAVAADAQSSASPEVQAAREAQAREAQAALLTDGLLPRLLQQVETARSNSVVGAPLSPGFVPSVGPPSPLGSPPFRFEAGGGSLGGASAIERAAIANGYARQALRHRRNNNNRRSPSQASFGRLPPTPGHDEPTGVAAPTLAPAHADTSPLPDDADEDLAFRVQI